MRTLFLRDTGGRWLFAGLTVASLLLLAIDTATVWMAAPRQLASLVLLPVYVMADAPTRFGRFVDDNASNRSNLMEQRNGLRAEVERLNLELQRLAVLESENARLRLLLESKQRLALKVRAAEIVGVVPNPATRQVLLDKGARDGAYVGQPVVDADGVVGQVVDVTRFSSRVMLITDAAHAVPATVVRSGFRVIVVGTGEPDMVEVRHVTESGDIAEGDLLITSGLDQRFPAGYPVARIVSVSRDAGGAFARVRALPLAKLERESHVLLVFTPPPRPLSPRALDSPNEFPLPAGTLPLQGAASSALPAALAPAVAGAQLQSVSVPTTRPFVQPAVPPLVPANPSGGATGSAAPRLGVPGSGANARLPNAAGPVSTVPGAMPGNGTVPAGAGDKPRSGLDPAPAAPRSLGSAAAARDSDAGDVVAEGAAVDDEDAVSSDLLPIPARVPLGTPAAPTSGPPATTPAQPAPGSR